MSLGAQLVEYAKTHARFTAEQALVTLVNPGGDGPRSTQMGSLFRKALVEPGYVLPIGSTKAQGKAAKGRTITVWKSTICPDQHEIVELASTLAMIHGDINMKKITVLEGLRKAYLLGAGN